jgi:hypothetical protein
MAQKPDVIDSECEEIIVGYIHEVLAEDKE